MNFLQKTEASASKLNYEEKLSLIRLCILIGVSDGVLSDEELDFFSQLHALLSLGETESVECIINEFEKMDAMNNSNSLIADWVGVFRAENTEFVVDAMTSLAAADSHIAPIEHHIVQSVIDAVSE